MKKNIILIMCILSAFILTACGKNTANEESAQTASEERAVFNEQTETSESFGEVDKLIASMDIYEKVWQMFMVAPEDIIPADPVIAAGAVTKASIEKYPVGGFIYFSKNIETKDQIAKMLSGAQSFSKIPLFTAVDEEGGRVARLGNADIGVTKHPPMAEIGKTGDETKARETGEVLGRELKELGFNVDFAPVADVITVENNEDIGDRSFGSDPELAAKMVAAEIDGMHKYGLCATLKHFPSNGSASANTHYASAVCTRTLEEMRSAEFIPFKAGIEAGADMVMAAHMAVPDIVGDETPSTLSSIIINDLLRNELGFKGVVVSDALNMGAITSNYSPAEAALKAVGAGVDIILMSPDPISAVGAITDAVYSGEISEKRIDQSLERILGLKYKSGIL